MKPELIVIDTLEGLEKLKAYLAPFDYIAFDTETTGLSRQDEIIGLSVCAEETKAFYVLLQRFDVETKQLIPTPCQSVIKEFLPVLRDKSLICHNAVFDCMMVKSNYDIDLMPYLHTDTLILGHLLNENRKNGLKELAYSLFGEDSAQESKEMKESVLRNGGKLTKKTYEMWKCDSLIMAKYGAKDALLTYKLFLALVPKLYEQGLDKFFYEDESMPLLRGPTYDLNTVGLEVDTEKLLTLKKTLEAECEELKASIYKEIHDKVKDRYPGITKNTSFNIGACQQLSWLLFGVYELEFGTLTKAGKTLCKQLDMRLPYSKVAKRTFIAEVARRKDQDCYGKKIRDPWVYIAVDKAILKKIAPKLKWVEKLLEYQKKMKLLSTYVEGIEERVRYGIIQPSFLQHGTSSGRFASRNPNFQNLPRDDKRIKSCIKARRNRVFVGADYSQLEPRVFASISNDARLLESFKSGWDFYSTIGIETYEKPECSPQKEGPGSFGQEYPKLRQDSKVFTLAATYGATGYQLAPLMGKTPEEAQQDIDRYFEKFPKVKEMMEDSHNQAKANGYVTNIFGRPRRIPDAKKITQIYKKTPHSELPYEARKLLNLSVNHRIQSTAASIVNRAAIELSTNCRLAGIDCRLVLQVHDSLIVECREDDAQSVALLMQDAMENAVHLPGVKLEAVPKIGKTLADV